MAVTKRRKLKIHWGIVKVVASVVICVALLGAAAGALYLIYQTEPTAQREGATRKSAALVETVAVYRGSYRPELVVLGRVEPAREVMLSPRVSGQVVTVDPKFMPGGVIEAGDPLVQLDPTDFKKLVLMRQSELRQIEADLAIEQGRQTVARTELAALDQEIEIESRALVLREPQIDAIKARVDAAKAEFEQAQLDLQRTQINAPFDTQIMARMVNVGSQVTAGDPLARLVGIDEYWVIARLPLRSLAQVAFPEAGTQGASVRVRMKTAWEPGVSREGHVTRLIGDVDPQSRLAQVLITVKDPLARQSEGPPLLLNTIVEARIDGQYIVDVVRLDRDLLRQNNTVWVMKEGKLTIREVDIAFQDATHAYIRDGLDDGDSVVSTSLSTVSEGVPLRLSDQPADRSEESGAGQ